MFPLPSNYFDQDAVQVARDLLGKVICRKHGSIWLKARIIETEAYYAHERGSHASLGMTPSRKALFMSAGTIYMYYSRGKDSLNVSCAGPGNAVLIKAAYPFEEGDSRSYAKMIATMQKLSPKNGAIRPAPRLLSGQTLLCSAMNIRVPEWNQKNFDPKVFYFADVGDKPEKILVAKRLGIPIGRDENLPYRFLDARFERFCTRTAGRTN